jgi:DNA-binding transcriptional MerR regulator
MLTSRTLLEATGISRATLNNYIAMGLLPKPQVKRMSPAPGEPAATLGYFPDWALDRIEQIQHLKKSGQALEDIRHALGVYKQKIPQALKIPMCHHSPEWMLVKTVRQQATPQRHGNVSRFRSRLTTFHTPPTW